MVRCVTLFNSINPEPNVIWLWMMDRLNKTSEEHDMKINIKKTKIMRTRSYEKERAA